MGLSGVNVVITGGGSGIGAAVARSLAEAGAKVVIAGRNADKLEKICEANPESIHAVAGDVSCRDSVDQLFAKSREILSDIHVLVTAAGINVPQRMMHNLSPEDWDRMMSINSTGVFNCFRAVLPEMRERKSGTIVNISSVAGIRAASLGGVGYNASKFASTGLGISVGDEERDHGIRVTNIYPGEGRHSHSEQRPSPVTDEHRARILQPEDVAATVKMVVELPARARIPELTIIPIGQGFV